MHVRILLVTAQDGKEEANQHPKKGPDDIKAAFRQKGKS